MGGRVGSSLLAKVMVTAGHIIRLSEQNKTKAVALRVDITSRDKVAGGQAALCMPLLGISMDWVTIAAGIHHQYASPCSRTNTQFSAVRPLKIALRPLLRVSRYMEEGLQAGCTSGFATARFGKATPPVHSNYGMTRDLFADLTIEMGRLPQGPALRSGRQGRPASFDQAWGQPNRRARGSLGTTAQPMLGACRGDLLTTARQE